MAFHSLDNLNQSPSENLQHFTNRICEQDALNRVLAISEEESLPVIMFFGVAGNGKTWLLKRLREKAIAASIPNALLNLDKRIGELISRRDKAGRLAEIRRQLGSEIKCPNFDLAYAWLRAKQGDVEDPAFRGGSAIGVACEFLREFCQLAVSDVPGGSLLAWCVNKITKPLMEKIASSGLKSWLANVNGEKRFLQLLQSPVEDIAAGLTRDLLCDLRNSLPNRGNRKCRGILFLDTFESLSDPGMAIHAQLTAQAWARDLFHPDSPLQIIIAGRDHLHWGASECVDFTDSHCLEQHLLGGLSEEDATDFLKKCDIGDLQLQQSILRVCLDTEVGTHPSATHDHSPETGFHPFALGLAADTIHNWRTLRRDVNSADFDFTPGDVDKLATLFLQSMGTERANEIWIKQIALPIRFDSAAAMHAYSPVRNVTSTAAWQSLCDYSFISEIDSSGWYRLHPRMRNALIRLTENGNTQSHVQLKTNHANWQQYWSDRSVSEFDNFASLAWHHRFRISPFDAIVEWESIAKQAREQQLMADHFSVLSWPDAILAETESLFTHASLLAKLRLSLGQELCFASLGNKKENRERAIEHFEASLDVFTNEDYPEVWALLQVSLGIAFTKLPVKNRAEILERAISCFENASSIYSQDSYPFQWASIQKNLGVAYSEIPTGDKQEHLDIAIKHYVKALSVDLLAKKPDEWANIQNDLGNAFAQLRTGNLAENLGNAISCFEAALSVLTKDRLPLERARTLSNLGAAYGQLPTGDHGENLMRATKCYEEALTIRTCDMFPHEWAITQYNLGCTLCEPQPENLGERLNQAILCFKAALRICTRDSFPELWVLIQNALGNAYSDSPTGDRRQNLSQAIDCYEATMNVVTLENNPEDFEGINKNLNMARAALEKS